MDSNENAQTGAQAGVVALPETPGTNAEQSGVVDRTAMPDAAEVTGKQEAFGPDNPPHPAAQQTADQDLQNRVQSRAENAAAKQMRKTIEALQAELAAVRASGRGELVQGEPERREPERGESGRGESEHGESGRGESEHGASGRGESENGESERGEEAENGMRYAAARSRALDALASRVAAEARLVRLEHTLRETERRLAEEAGKREMLALRQRFPEIVAEQPAALGEPYLSLRRAGVPPAEAYAAASAAAGSIQAPPPMGPIGQEENSGRRFYTPSEVDALSARELDDRRVMERVLASMKQWKRSSGA